MMDERQMLILIAKLTGTISKQLTQIEDTVERESAIYAMLCVLKEDHSESFEKALIFYLKEGLMK